MSQGLSLAARLAEFFHEHADEWIDGRTLSKIGGYAAWRTRVSDLRRGPYHMSIENRQRRIERDGEVFVVSEYRYLPVVVVERPAAAESERSRQDEPLLWTERR